MDYMIINKLKAQLALWSDLVFHTGYPCTLEHNWLKYVICTSIEMPLIIQSFDLHDKITTELLEK